ncbi:Chitinase 2 [Mucor velutinosus]|uniref:Chitinase 2 n=1 Tax=Mucor velutinosus TaxID=708070 RepID=A0AAN7HXV3_9FUNG|nr:Chitinase 2 [Mucor velutinosus]
MDNHNGQFRGQPYGNVILIHQTATTASSSSLNGTLPVSNQRRQETATGSALEQKTHHPQEAEAEILKDLKQPSKQISLASTIYTYFGNLIHGKSKNSRFRAGSVNDTAKNPQQKQTAWWKRGFKSLSPPTIAKRSKGQGKKRNQKFLWCFRPVGAAAATHGKKQNPLFWTTFEKKNQLELSEQFERLRAASRIHDCFELQDKKINGGKVVVNVMLKEGIAFVLDPEWSEPMTFEITQLPKLTLYQRLRARHDYKRWYKRQQQHMYHQSRSA